MVELHVQAAASAYQRDEIYSWRREPLKNKTPLPIRRVFRCFETVPELITREKTPEDAMKAKERSFMNKAWREKYFSPAWLKLYAKWIPTCIELLFIVSIFDDIPLA